jgi:hypothetical protein
MGHKAGLANSFLWRWFPKEAPRESQTASDLSQRLHAETTSDFIVPMQFCRIEKVIISKKQQTHSHSANTYRRTGFSSDRA